LTYRASIAGLDARHDTVDTRIVEFPNCNESLGRRASTAVKSDKKRRVPRPTAEELFGSETQLKSS
jgi:hypothetical protein